MTKNEAIELCGADNATDLARLMGITRQAIGQWPNELPQRYADRIVGLAVRLGRITVCSPSQPPSPS